MVSALSSFGNTSLPKTDDICVHDAHAPYTDIRLSIFGSVYLAEYAACAASNAVAFESAGRAHAVSSHETIHTDGVAELEQYVLECAFGGAK